MLFSPLAVFFSFLMCVHAYSDGVLEDLKKGSYLANAAYCSDAKLLPEVQFEGKYYMEQHGLKIIKAFKPRLIDNHMSCTGFIAVNDTAKQIVISFRGSISVQDWIVDFSFIPTSYVPIASDKRCPGNCLVHHGVYEQFKLAFDEIYAALKQGLERHPDYEIMVTGHSLGGGYAYLMGLELQLLGHNPRLVTFGGLRMGNSDLNKWVDEQFRSSENFQLITKEENPHNVYIRVVQDHDVVHMMPTGPIYNHAGLLFTISGAKTNIPTKAEVRFDGYNSKLKELFRDIIGGGDFFKSVNILDHNRFFRRMAWPCMADSVAV